MPDIILHPFFFYFSSGNVGEFAKDMKMLAALQEEDSGENLLDAARRLAKAFSDLLTAAQPTGEQVGHNVFLFMPLPAVA